MYFDDSDDPIDICLDNVFKAVFTRNTHASQGALSKLISALIGREVSIIAISTNEPPIDNLRDRQIRFDINCFLRRSSRRGVENAEVCFILFSAPLRALREDILKNCITNI